MKLGKTIYRTISMCFPYRGFVWFAIWATLPGTVFGQTATPTVVVTQESTTKLPFVTMSTGDPLLPEPPDTIRRDEQGRVSVRAVRVDQIKVDGALDEEVYQTTSPITGFIQQEPREGEPVSEPTEAWVFFDDNNIYVSARCIDSHPEQMVLTELRRDNYTIFNNENFTVVLDTFHDKRNGYNFQVSALGALRDCTITDEGNLNCDWNTVWDARVKRNDQGYTAEIMIPFKSIRYREGPNQVWMINLRRVIRWKNEQAFITRIPASYGSEGGYYFSLAATLYGLEVPVTSANLELKPYVISDLRTDRNATPAILNNLGANAGFDVKYGLTRSLITDFTYNTDFAQVEDDQQQVNLTRFSLYYPEKREFFLEGQGIFNFGSGGEDRHRYGGGLTPVFFFSRRIGLSKGQSVPIVAGGRMTGRAGKYTLGLLNIETGRSDQVSVEPTNFSVVRVRRDFLRRSAIGFMTSNRSLNSEGTGSNQAFGVDANLAFYENVDINAYYAQTRTPGRSEDDVSYYGNFSYGADRFGFSYQRLVVEENFNPDIGFLRRSDFQQDSASVRFSPRPKRWESIRKFYYQGSLDYVADRDDHLETREVDSSFQIEFQNSDRVQVSYSNNYEYLPNPFAIASNVTLPVGGYGFQSMSASYSAGVQHRASGRVSVSRGTFYTGTKTALSYNGGRITLNYQFLVEPVITLNFVDLPEGSFNSNVIGARTTYMFSPRSFVSALLQVNSASHVFTTNVRFRWEYQPNSELFVVYSDGRDTNVSGFPTMQNRGFVVKLTKLFRY
ncbi:MAG: DUF5916 domain-containing protein [Patescibacteria group bacterium]